MTAESAFDRQQQWELAVRRSFGIPDVAAHKDAREELIRSLQNHLRDNGWQRPTRGICEPLVDALLALGASEDLDDRDAAYRLVGKGITVVDPERLVFDARFEYPSEVVAVAQHALDRVGHYTRDHPGTWLPSS